MLLLSLALSAQRPNIVFKMADDLGGSDLPTYITALLPHNLLTSY